MPARQPINIQPKRILVITLRYLGDTLLVTPLISSLKRAYPHAEIDVLLPGSNVGMLEGNPDVSRLIPIAVKPNLLNFGKLLIGLFRRYDLAISTQAGDRPILCAVMAGKFSMGFVARNAPKDNWKRRLMDRALEADDEHSHAVLENLRFCQPLNIAPSYTLTPPRTAREVAPAIPDGKYAVLHIMPQWRYKQWHDEGWIRVAYYLNQKGCQILLTGSAQAAEQEALQALLRRMPPSTRNLAGKLSLSQLTGLIENATLFIGPDTGITHLAAATGATTVALFGPTDPAKWAPWPAGYAENSSPFVSLGSQHVNNVYLVQGGAAERACVPCQMEGCDRHRQSYAACLDNLSSEKVIGIISRVV
jgi:heptosyltransferase III